MVYLTGNFKMLQNATYLKLVVHASAYLVPVVFASVCQA